MKITAVWGVTPCSLAVGTDMSANPVAFLLLYPAEREPGKRSRYSDWRTTEGSEFESR
jgi:hypothetical protein